MAAEGRKFQIQHRRKHRRFRRARGELNSLPAVLKDLQLPSVQLCPVKLGDGALHVTAGGELHHPEAQAAVTALKQRTHPGHGGETHPSFLLGL